MKRDLPRASSRGFTLIELLVVIAMVILLTSVTLATFVSVKNKRSVKVQAENLRNIISEARSLAVSPPNIVNNKIGPVSEVLVKIDYASQADPSVRIWIHYDDNTDNPWSEYRDYSAGFNKVKFGTGSSESYSVVFDATTPRVGQLDPSSTNPIILTSLDGTSARYQITVNNFGFSNIVPF